MVNHCYMLPGLRGIERLHRQQSATGVLVLWQVSAV